MSRRQFLRAAAAASVAPWFAPFARAAAPDPKRKRACILLWMAGGPSTLDLWDLKPGHDNGGPFRDIPTTAPGVRISEHLPRVAARMNHLSVIRSMSTREGDHSRATYLLRTGNLPQGGLDYPAFGAALAKELADDANPLPPFVSIAPQRFFAPAAYSAGFLGPRFSPLVVADGRGFGTAPRGRGVDAALRVPDLAARDAGPTPPAARRDLLRDLETDFVRDHPGPAAAGHAAAVAGAARLMAREAAEAFDLSDEKPALRDRYGRSLFGQGCLLARRLVERGVPFVEVTLAAAPGAPAGWDTHVDNFDAVKALSGVLDPAWATLLDDLKDRGLLDTTTVAWMGEFGRTPRINPQGGRDHFPGAWAAVLGGGGIKGGQVVGRTSPDGSKVEERPVTTPDFLATLCRAIGVDPDAQNPTPGGRPIRVVDRAGQAVTEIL